MDENVSPEIALSFPESYQHGVWNQINQPDSLVYDIGKVNHHEPQSFTYKNGITPMAQGELGHLSVGMFKMVLHTRHVR